MNGDIVAVGKSVLVSNAATIDLQTDVVDTPEGPRSVKTKVIDIRDPFGMLEAGEQVKVAFRAEDGSKYSYRCTVRQCSGMRCVLVIEELLNSYKEILKEGKAWLV